VESRPACDREVAGPPLLPIAQPHSVEGGMPTALQCDYRHNRKYVCNAATAWNAASASSIHAHATFNISMLNPPPFPKHLRVKLNPVVLEFSKLWSDQNRLRWATATGLIVDKACVSLGDPRFRSSSSSRGGSAAVCPNLSKPQLTVRFRISIKETKFQRFNISCGDPHTH
jgi:hypothetical protein